MRSLRLVSLLLPLALVACRGAGLAECSETGDCPAPEVCNRHTRICYTPDPVFSVDITHPLPNASLTGSQFQLTGDIHNAAEGLKSLELRIADGGWTPIEATDAGHFEQYPEVPAADGVPLDVSVRATDLTNRQVVSTVSIIIDNVAPVATLTALDQERGHVPNIAVDFSEPVLPDDPNVTTPLMLTPSAGDGAWNESRTQFRVANLLPDTHYVAEVAANVVRDAAGNLNKGTRAEFRTGPRLPDGGTALSSPNGATFTLLDATADQDGVVTLAGYAPGAPSQVLWGWFDPATGGFVSHAIAAQSVARLKVGASVDDGLEAPRIHTLTLDANLPDGGVAPQIFWTSDHDDGGVHSQLSGALAVIPGPPGCGEIGADDALGFVADAGSPLYRRGALQTPLALAPDAVVYASPSDWSLVTVDPNTISVRRFQFDCDGGTPPGPGTDRALPPSAEAIANFSAAAVPGDALWAYDDGSDPRVACEQCVGAAQCASTGRPALRVSPMHEASWVLGAYRNDAQQVILTKADLAQACPPSAPSGWSDIGAVPDSSAILTFRPVMFGKTAGLVYLGSTGQIRIFQSSTP